jgi:hypothetical protein
LYLDLLFFESCCDKIFQSDSFYKLHDNVKNFEGKYWLLTFVFIRGRFLKLDISMMIDRNRITFLELNPTVIFEMNVIVFFKHHVIIVFLWIIFFEQFWLFSFVRMFFKENFSSWPAPVLINVLKILFLFKVCDWHIVKQFFHVVCIFQPRLMVSDNVWMV